jgi:zinc transport system ATP-binding protein
LRVCVGLLRPSAGEVRLFGQPLDRFGGRCRLGYVPQRAAASAAFPATVAEIVAVGRTPRRGLLRRFNRDDRRAIDRAIEWLGLESLRNRMIGELSGGEYQRVMVARALAGDPELLLLDEPGTGLDAAAKAQLLDLLKRLCATEELAIVYVSHDLEALHPYMSRVALLNRRLLFFGTLSALQERQDLQQQLNEAAIMADHYAQQEARTR